MNIEEQKQYFCTLAEEKITHDGVKELLTFLKNNTDFFVSPCSTRYHLCVEGGLVQHSINVAKIFDELCETYYPELSVSSRYLCGLFHDLCKYHCYAPVKKSRKTGRLLPNGKPEWEDYYGYDFDEQFPYGHGEKSVYLLSKFIELTDEESMAIRWHMGFSDSTFKGGQQSVSNAMCKYPIITLLHCADIIATTIFEE